MYFLIVMLVFMWKLKHRPSLLLFYWKNIVAGIFFSQDWFASIQFFSCILTLIYLKRIVNFSGAYTCVSIFSKLWTWQWRVTKGKQRRKTHPHKGRTSREIFILQLTLLILLIHFKSCLSNFKYLRILKVYSTSSFLLLVFWPETAHFKFISFLEQYIMSCYFVKTTFCLEIVCILLLL